MDGLQESEQNGRIGWTDSYRTMRPVVKSRKHAQKDTLTKGPIGDLAVSNLLPMGSLVRFSAWVSPPPVMVATIALMMAPTDAMTTGSQQDAARNGMDVEAAMT